MGLIRKKEKLIYQTVTIHLIKGIVYYIRQQN